MRNASTSSAFQPNTRSAGERPGSPQSASIVGPSGSPGSIDASARRTDSGIGAGRSAGTRIRPRQSTSVAIALARIVPGLARSPPQLPEWCAAVAQHDGEIEVERAARPQEDRRPRSSARRGPSEAISTSAASSRACASQAARSPGDPTSSPISISSFALKPSRPRASMTRASAARLIVCWPLLSAVPRPYQRRPSTVDLPRRTPCAPLGVVTRDHVAVAVDQHGRRRRVLASLREQHRRRAGDRIRPQRPLEAELRDAAPISSVR